MIPSKHEPCLYSGTYKGHHILLRRQVDNFAISAKSKEVCYKLIEDINKHMQNKIHKLGLLQRFNGVDVLQSRNHVKLSNKTYIEKILKGKNIIDNHSATHPIPTQTDSKY